MALKSRIVFIDSESFVRMGLNFGHPAIRSFADLCQRGLLFHYISSVVQREVEAKIEDSIDQALASLKSFRRKARLLESIEDDDIRALFKDIPEADVHIKAITVFREFLLTSHTTVINASGVDPEAALSLYFDRVAPFGDGKKKSEFPDAFSILALLKELGPQSAYVVSDDPDLTNFCKRHESLISVPALDQFLDIYNEHESAITELVKRHIVSTEDALRARIAEEIEEAGAFNQAPWDDSEVDHFAVLKVHALEPFVVHVDEHGCSVLFDVDVDYAYSVTGPDFAGGYYDKEEGRMYVFGSTRHSGADTKTFSVELTLSYEFDGSSLGEVEETVTVVGMSDGVPLYVEEHGSDR